MTETKDSGSRDTFATGYQRDARESKGRYDLLPYHGVKALALLFERGAQKYGDGNFRLGAPIMRVLDSMLRHAFKASAGYEDEDHLAAVAWNALVAIDYLERIKRGELPKELDDRPKPIGDP